MLGLTSQGPLLAGWASGRQWLVIHATDEVGTTLVLGVRCPVPCVGHQVLHGSAPPNLQHGHPTWWPRHGHPPKGHRPVLKISRETFSHISPDVCTICIRHTAGGFSQTNSPIWRTGCTPCPRFPNGRPPQPENAGCVPKGSSFGGGVNAIGFLMVNIGLLAYPLHGGRETRELGPKK